MFFLEVLEQKQGNQNYFYIHKTQICNRPPTQLRFTYYLFLIFNIRLRLSKTVKPFLIGRLLVTNQSTRYSFFFVVCLTARHCQHFENIDEEMPGKCSLQDIWLQKPEFKDWLVKVKEDTVEPWFNDLRYNDILGITIHISLPGKS